jgi:transposase-like protein
MNLVSCSSKKSSYLLIWRCSPCSRFRSIRTDSVLSGQKLTFSLFQQLVFCLSIKSLANVAISQLLGVSENTFSDWIHTRLADFLVSNPSPLGGPGVATHLYPALPWIL